MAARFSAAGWAVDAPSRAELDVGDCSAVEEWFAGRPAYDLAVCAALASAYYGKPIDKYTAVFGEVGLTGEVRAVSYCEKRVAECVKMGFKKVLVPAKNMKSVLKYAEKISVVPILYVNTMIKNLFKD